MKRLMAMLIAFCFPLATSHAALISVDTRFGIGTAAQDTISGLEWLKPPVTSTPLISIASELAPGGKFAEYRYPVGDEFFCSLINAHTQLGSGLSCSSSGGGNDPATIARARAFVRFFFGEERPIFENGAFIAIEPPPPGSTQVFLATSAGFIFKDDPVVPSVEFDSQQITISSDRLNIPVFHWLVREVQPVAEPSSYLLISLGIVSLMVCRKRVSFSQSSFGKLTY